MTVRELIDALRSMPPDAPAVVISDHPATDGCRVVLSQVELVENAVALSGKDWLDLR